MKTSKYTPAPWSECTALSSDFYNIRYIDGAECEKVATIRHTVEMSQEEALANACLISAAPELLEALQEVVAISDRKHDAWDKARAAIAKATGGRS